MSAGKDGASGTYQEWSWTEKPSTSKSTGRGMVFEKTVKVEVERETKKGKKEKVWVDQVVKKCYHGQVGKPGKTGVHPASYYQDIAKAIMSERSGEEWPAVVQISIVTGCSERETTWTQVPT